MDFLASLRDSWRITWKNWPLWALAALMFFAFIPAGAIVGSFSAAANLLTFRRGDPLWNALPGLPVLINRIERVPVWIWLGLAVLALSLLVVTTSITLILQAASMRGAVIAAEQGRVGLGEALRLGRVKTFNLIKISLLFGLAIALTSVLPSLTLVFLGDRSPLGVSLIHLAQTGFTPITTALNFLLLLLTMAIALEDFSPRAAFGRAGNVFKTGWWAFIIVFALSGLSVTVAGVFLVIPFFLSAPLAFFGPEVGLTAMSLGLGCGGLLAAFFVLFTVVFTQTLYTLVYREAARLTAAKS